MTRKLTVLLPLLLAGCAGAGDYRPPQLPVAPAWTAANAAPRAAPAPWWHDFADPALDQLIAAADAEFDAGRRDALHRQAMAVAMADVAVVPIYAQTSYWASKADIVFQPSVGDETQIRFIHIAK